MSKLRLLWRVALFCCSGISTLAAQDFTLYDIYMVDMKTGRTQQVTRIPNAGEFNPSWSNNGKLIVHDVVTPDRSDLYITNVETGVSTLLPGSSGGNDAAWSPNGQTISFDRLPYGDLSIYTLPPGGGIPALVRTDAVDASWSPDNNHFVFRQPSDGTIRTASLSGGPARQLGYGETPAWSPNGLWVVFSSGGDLWKVRVSKEGIPSGSAVQLTDHPDWENQPTWTNDSKAIIFHSSRGGADFDLWTIPVEGGIPTKLTGRAGAGDYDPSVSNNGKLVAYAAVGEGVAIVGHSPGTIDRYSMSLSALKGRSTTDVCVMVSTSDPANYPLPSTLKKLQLKVLNNDGAVTFLQNYFDVPLSGGKACVSVDGLVPYQPVRVQAHIKTDQTIDEEILRGTATVFLRPDLIVDGVNAPQEVNKNVRFNVEARIREKNLQVGARATVGLFEGTNQLATASGVLVPAGEMVSVIFEGIRLSEPGTHELTIRISNADPAEYDETNNALSFPINVLDVSIRPMGYYFSYYLSEYTSTYRFNSCWWNYDYLYESAYRSFSFYAYDYPEATLPASPLDRLSWKIESEGGVWSQGALSNIAATYGDPYFEYYTVNLDPARPLYAYIYIYKYDFFKYVAFYVNQYASRYVYRVVENGVVYADYFYQDGDVIDAQQQITSSFLISDGDYNAGGGVVMPVYGYSSSSSTSDAGYNDYYGCDYSSSSEYSNRYATGWQSGMTDPGILPSASRSDLENLSEWNLVPLIPRETQLLANFPNPFNPSTIIRYGLPTRSRVRLIVYNILGQIVADLVNTEQVAGWNQVTWNANVSSGLYFYRLEAVSVSDPSKRFVDVKKMLLLK